MTAEAYTAPPIPSAFIWRRAHSLTGIWLVLFLMEHLFTNSQAALLIGDDGSGFVQAVNFLKDLPYLPVIESVFLGIPLFIHAIWGIRYLFTAKYNVFPTDGSSPSLPKYRGNKAYTWQRITSWILLFGIGAHVIQMRFLDHPTYAQINTERLYIIRISADEGLYTLSQRLGFKIYTREQANEIVQKDASLISPPQSKAHSPADEIALQKQQEEHNWAEALQAWPLNEKQLLAVSPSFGTVELLLVRDTFKSPLMMLLYTGLVLAACFHAFNGLWSSMITWGITLTARSQQLMRSLAVALMVLISFMGLAAIWGTYWINLTH